MRAAGERILTADRPLTRSFQVLRSTDVLLLGVGLVIVWGRSMSAATASFWHADGTALAARAETCALAVPRDHQEDDDGSRNRQGDQDHRKDVLEDPVPACHPLPILQRHSAPGRTIARRRIVQTRPERPSRWATEPNHRASCCLLPTAVHAAGDR